MGLRHPKSLPWLARYADSPRHCRLKKPPRHLHLDFEGCNRHVILDNVWRERRDNPDSSVRHTTKEAQRGSPEAQAQPGGLYSSGGSCRSDRIGITLCKQSSASSPRGGAPSSSSSLDCISLFFPSTLFNSIHQSQ